MVSKYTNPGSITDVGCAAGFILKGFQQSGWKCHGLEPNDRMAEYGRSELSLDITTGNLENFQTGQQFDLVSLVQVIGHFVDLDKAMENILKILSTNGLVLVESWDMKSNMAKIMGKHWHEYSPPSVINWFSDATLTDFFNYHGFGLIAKGRPSKKISIKHGLSLFEESTPKFIFKKELMIFFSRILAKLKINYPPFDVKWYLFKKL